MRLITSALDRRWLYGCILSFLCLTACESKRQPAQSPIFGRESFDTDSLDCYDLPEIQEATLLIGGTLSGPDTYYEYRGQGMGRQFRLAEEFARSIGVKLQMDIAPDTATLLQQLANGNIDFIALEMPQWKTRPDAPLLSKAISEWWRSGAREAVLKSFGTMSHVTKRHMRPVMKDRAKGIISPYDHLFVRYSQQVRWDWRLIAALCYQESGFDPEAVSWAGARGLMQIMPGTASLLGVGQKDIHDPETNISAGTRYLAMLDRQFSDIGNSSERIRFVLAAYNGGARHIRDAMALASAYGGNPNSWEQVAPYVLRLSDPQYYRNPVVQYGYMRGSETSEYVSSIIRRWQGYRQSARPMKSGSTPSPAQRHSRFGTHDTKVKSAEEWVPVDSL
ncbi:MAG: transglycosylase SLT domain-containing protein [Bacteroidaceae bacterium]